jgi:hypothetical protein
MKQTSTVLVFFFLAFFPAIVHAHSLSPLHYPLGPLPILLWKEDWAFVFMAPTSYFATTCVLWAWVRPPRLAGHLWRALIIYAVARVFETAMLFVFPLVGWSQPGWTPSSWETVISLVICLLAGAVSAALIGLFLYQGFSSPKWRRLLAVVTATAGGYFAAYGLVAMRMWNS